MPAMAKEGKVTRIYGKDRYETSLKVADELSNSYEKIIVASGEIFSDALSGSILTEGKYPIVLTLKDRLVPSVRAKIAKAKEVYILGGSETISSAVENDIKSLGVKVSRLSGMDRYETSVKIAQETGSKDLILVNGDLFPDSLTASGIALLNNKSILLVKSNEMPQSVKDYIKKINPSSITIIGGNKSVDDRLEKESKLFASNVKRISGRDRYETSLEVAKQFTNLKNLVVASGDNFSDALSASSIAGKLKAPMLLVDGRKGTATVDYIEKIKKNIDSIKVIGGPNTVSDSTFKSILNVVETKVRGTGEDKKITDTIIKPNKDKPSPEKPNPDKPNPENPQLADKPANGIWYGTAFEGYGPEQNGASIVKVEIKDGKIKSAEAIKHCASDDYYIGLAEKLLPLLKDMKTSDIDSIVKELSNGEGKNKGKHADVVTGATRTSRGYAIAIKNAIERARKFEFDKKEQEINYIKITGDNVNRPDFDRVAISGKSNLKNGTSANFDFVEYDIAMSDGTLKKKVKFSELKEYGIASNYKQGDILNTDKDHITLNVIDKTGYAFESIELKVAPKEEKVKVRPTHAIITFEDSSEPKTQKVDIQEDKFAYDLGTFRRKIEKVELFKGNDVVSKGEFKEGFNYWWFDKLQYQLKENEKWEFDNYKIITRVEENVVPNPEEPIPQPPQQIKDYYPVKYIFKDKQTQEKVAEINIEEWGENSYSKNIKKDILKKYEGKLDKDSFTVEVLNKANQQLKVKSIIVLNKKMHGIETEVAEGEEHDKRTLNVFWDFKLETVPTTKISDFVPTKVIIKDIKTNKIIEEFTFNIDEWMYSSVLKRLNKNIDNEYNNLKENEIEVKAYNKFAQELNVMSTKIGGTSSILVLTAEIDNPNGEQTDKNTLTVTWKK